MPNESFRAALALHRPVHMAWVTMGQPYIVEQLGAAGYHAVLVDRQHGMIGHAELVNCLTAARAAGLPALVRPLTRDTGSIGQALDAGAQGVVCPLVETAADVEEVVRAVKYPPLGTRSWGPYRGKFLVEGDYFEHANHWTVACVQIETRAALDNLDTILQVEGLEMILVGPNDLAAALTGARDIHAKEVTDAIAHVFAKCRAHNVIAAAFANDVDYARPLAEAGWDVLSVGTDAGLLAEAGARTIRSLRD